MAAGSSARAVREPGAGQRSSIFLQGSLIRSGRKRGPDVWQFRWADKGPFGKRIYRRRVIGTVCQYADAESARKSVAGLLRKLNANALQRCHLPMTIAEVCDHFMAAQFASGEE